MRAGYDAWPRGRLPHHVLADRLERLERELRCLTEISSSLNSPFELDELLNAICARVCGEMLYKACSVMLVDESTRVLTIRGYHGMDPAYVEQLNSSRAIRLDGGELSRGPSGQAYTTGRPSAIANIYTNDRFRPWLSANPGFSSVAAVPLNFRGQRIGILNCYTAEPHEYSPHELDLLSTVAAQAAVAIGIARLLREQARIIEEQLLLNARLQEQRDLLLHARQIHDRLTAVVLAGGDAQAVAAALGELLGCPVEVFDADGASAGRHLPPGHPEPPSFPDGLWAGALDRALQDARAVRLPAGGGRAPRCRLVAAPVMAGDERLGAVVAVEVRPLTDVDLAAIERAATVLALEFTKQRALNELQQRLKTDWIDDAVRGREPEGRLRARARHLGYRLAPRYRVVLVDVERVEGREGVEPAARLTDSHRARALRALETACQSAGYPALAAARSGGFTVLQPDVARGAARSREPGAREIQDALRNVLGDCVVSVATGRPCERLADIGRSYEEAQDAMAILHKLGRRGQALHFADLGIYRVLLQAAEPRRLVEFARDALGPLLEHERQRSGDLLPTLRSYLSCGCNVQQSAEELHVHPNTVLYRLRKIEQLTGLDLRNTRDLMHLQLALMVHDISG